MTKPRVVILRSPGANCDVETAFAFDQAGGDAERIHVNRVLEQPAVLADFQILCVPGGFSYGDDIAAGRILGNQVRHHLAETLQGFHAAGKLVLGICNGFQVLLKTGMLLEEDQDGPRATLTWNDAGRFEDRWVTLATEPGSCVFLQGVETLELPIAHAEGKFVTRDRAVLDELGRAGQLVLRYARRDAPAVTSDPVPYPDNPNASIANVAGVSDRSGRVLGLMPHPERFIHRTQHPRWTREDIGPTGQGLKVFENAVWYFK
jgi:phosphoribosylformylglycinamidine synthase